MVLTPKSFNKKLQCLSLAILLGINFLFAQFNTRNNSNSSYSGNNNTFNPNTKKDSLVLKHRDNLADSITISYRYYDSSKTHKLDSSINDFNTRYTIPYWYINLGNYGTATHSLLFQPNMKAGWSEGLNQYNTYNYSTENTKFYQTTKPFTELTYLVGSKSEMITEIIHTQNRKSRFNFSLEYRFTNAAGYFKSQNANNNNLRFTTHYQSNNKRYEIFAFFLSNKNASSENGGLVNVNKLQSLSLNDPYELDTRLGYAATASRNPFNTTVNTGNKYNESTLLFRHQYDFGQKDSLVISDTETVKLFYPRLRLQHTLTLQGYSYNFFDYNADSTAYSDYFNYKISSTQTTVSFKDNWNNLTNEFSVISFPDKKNPSQFLKLGTSLQNLKGTFNDSSKFNNNNWMALGEYRNKTRNNKWDLEALLKIYLNGLNEGDIETKALLKRNLSNRIGSLQLEFQNINRTPPAIFHSYSSFNFKPRASFQKENITQLSANYYNPRFGWKFNADYFLVNNYLYYDSFFSAKQFASLFNLLHIELDKKTRLSKHWNWYLEAHLQQATGNAPLSIPLLLTRNRLAYEGNFYTNLFLSTGVEIRYYTNYHAADYSPFNGQFFYQNSYTTSNRPDINLFFNLRIKSFKAFARLENINTLNNGFSFTHYNFLSKLYPDMNARFRLGIWWNFVN